MTKYQSSAVRETTPKWWCLLEARDLFFWTLCDKSSIEKRGLLSLALKSGFFDTTTSHKITPRNNKRITSLSSIRKTSWFSALLLLHFIQKTHAYIHTLYAKGQIVDNFTAWKALYTGIIPKVFSSTYIFSLHEKFYWPTLLSNPAKERNLIHWCTYSLA